MKLKYVKVLLILICCLLVFSVTALGEEEESGVQPDWEMYFPNIRVLGTDFTFAYHGLSLFDSVPTDFYFIAGFANETAGFYRNADGTPYTPPTDGGVNHGLYIRNDFVWSVGVKQGIMYNEDLDKNLVDAFAFYKGKMDQNLEADSKPGSLIFDSNLPDENGITQHTFLVGASYNTVERNMWFLTRRGIYAEASLEVAPEAMNDVANFTRFNINLEGFLPIMETEKTSIYLADRIIWDNITGEYIPINARTTVGALRAYPGYREYPGMPSEAGLGGAVRGIDSYRFDGKVKFVNNFDVRINFPDWFSYTYIPGIIVYYDMGAYDNGTDEIDFSKMFYTTGIGFHMSIWRQDMVVYYNYFINENRGSFGINVGVLQF